MMSFLILNDRSFSSLFSAAETFLGKFSNPGFFYIKIVRSFTARYPLVQFQTWGLPYGENWFLASLTSKDANLFQASSGR